MGPGKALLAKKYAGKDEDPGTDHSADTDHRSVEETQVSCEDYAIFSHFLCGRQ